MNTALLNFRPRDSGHGPRYHNMANGTFFVSWELWQQMTFVLAMGIVAVFFIGLAKLWWTNRQMKKIEELDAEKQVRMAQMRRSGLSANRRSRLGSEIPFGVKAIETGVEVEGVWIARMASMATRPPDRKWSSKRKVKTPMPDLDDANPGRWSGRGSIRAGRISRREIIKPSAQTGKKLENLQVREGEIRLSGSAGNNRLPVNLVDDEQARSLTPEDKTGVSTQRGPLGRIQRSLKKMTSMEARNEQQRRHQLGGQEVREFRINSQARKPQRFYPEDATPIAPVAPLPSHRSIPQRRSSLVSETGRSLADAEKTKPRDVVVIQPTRQSSTVPRSHEPRRQTSHASSVSSVDSFVTSIEELKEFAPRSRPPPLEHHPVFSSADREAPEEDDTFGRRRSRRSPQNHVRQSSSEDRSTIHEQQDAAQSAPSTALRYPPNSSRSAAYIQPRPQSSSQDQQQQQQQNHGAPSTTQPSPTFGPSDSYINTSTRKVNSNFEVLPAGTFGLPEQQATEGPASAAASVRSSFESQRSRERRKLQKKRTSSHYSK
ncbi:hypothetical protein N8I77_003306 [Diaporthe amygdali]|uniref:Uncharacterized protein n=1 Tax=Phomopsis amygdali TaxID=1214568 RepID=A0AAD9SIL1_PHOAM|nr:hypothetical protein N8I77_003306 [Diaporthe amygdali]